MRLFDAWLFIIHPDLHTFFWISLVILPAWKTRRGYTHCVSFDSGRMEKEEEEYVANNIYPTAWGRDVAAGIVSWDQYPPLGLAFMLMSFNEVCLLFCSSWNDRNEEFDECLCATTHMCWVWRHPRVGVVVHSCLLEHYTANEKRNSSL